MAITRSMTARHKHHGHTYQRQPEPKTPKLGFTSLPPELRLTIYERLLLSAKAILLEPDPISRWKPATVEVHGRQDIHPNILRCNRAIRGEAGYVLYRRNIFTVWCPCPRYRNYDPELHEGGWSWLLQWLGMIGPHNRSHITDLRIRQQPQYANTWIRRYMRKLVVLLGKDSQWRRTLTVELQEGLPYVTKRPQLPPAWYSASYFRYPNVRVGQVKRAERYLRDSTGRRGVEILFEAKVRKNGLSGNLDSLIVASGWEIVEREDCESRNELGHIRNISIYKLRMSSQLERTDAKASR